MENSTNPLEPTKSKESDTPSDASAQSENSPVSNPDTPPTDTTPASTTPAADTAQAPQTTPGPIIASVTPTSDPVTQPPEEPSATPDSSPSLLTPEASPAPVGTHLPGISTKKRLPITMTIIVVIALLVMAGAATAGYLAGKHAAKPSKDTTTASMMPAAKTVPAGATIIEQCEPGLGTQYVLPKDIPDGPVYNVYKGKLIGVEYMTDLATLQNLNTKLSNLPLYSQQYDHINIMSMPAHSGFPTPHYQVDVMMVPTTTTDKITCGSGASDMQHMSGMTSSGTSTTMPMSGTDTTTQKTH